MYITRLSRDSRESHCPTAASKEVHISSYYPLVGAARFLLVVLMTFFDTYLLSGPHVLQRSLPPAEFIAKRSLAANACTLVASVKVRRYGFSSADPEWNVSVYLCRIRTLRSPYTIIYGSQTSDPFDPSRNLTMTRPFLGQLRHSAFHPSGVGKSITGLSGWV